MYLQELSDLEKVQLPVLLAGLVPIVLLLGFVILAAWGKRMQGGGWLAVGLSGAMALIGAFVGLSILSENNTFLPWHVGFEWFQIGGKAITFGIWLDHKSGAMLALVTGISFLVHVFSLTYIARDELRHRYWAYLALFSAAMCGLVLADNLLLMFIFWELVGLSSYLLIGFWFKQKIPAMASQKAFIVNRIADAGFVMALMIMFWRYGHFFPGVMATITPQLADYLICIGLIIAAVGKSAQFPFQVWLPDAMAGPTPVSSLIHAATMVVAGVYLLIRIAPGIPDVLLGWVAVLGALTALAAAISALTQTDIKRVLAYSTVSQLGFMVMGIGVGAVNYAFFHLLTHAFFKCGLFLVAGVVIHHLHLAQEKSHVHFDAQDMRFMGGLRRQMPLVFACWLFFAASLAGLPLFSGFMSKDGILIGALDFARVHGGWAWVVPIAGIAASLLTAFYITRQGFLVFMGRNRALGAGAKADFMTAFPTTNWKMLVPLVLLALGSTWVLFSPGNPLHPSLLKAPLHAEPSLPWIFVGIALVGILAAAFIYRKGPLPNRASGFLFDLSFKHFFLDDGYRRFLVKPFLAMSRLLALVDHHLVDGAVRVVAGAILRKDTHAGPDASLGTVATTERPSLSWASAWLDKNFIDRLVNGVAALVQRGGKQAAHLQSGRVQLYILYSLLALLLLLLGLIFIFTA